MIFLGDPYTTALSTARRDASILSPITAIPTALPSGITSSGTIVSAEGMPTITTGEASTPALEPQPDAFVPGMRTPFYKKPAFWGFLGLVAAVGIGAAAWGRAG